MAKLVWTEESLDALRQIGDYIAESNHEAASTVTQGIWQKSQVLIEFPQLGWRHEEIVGRDLRSLLYGHYRIVYELESTEVVRVLSVVHTSLDIGRLTF